MFGKDKNSNPEILVRIKQDPLDETVKRRVQKSSDGLKTYVVMEKPTKEKPAGWNLDVTGCIRPSKQGLTVDCFRGQTRAIKYDVAGNKEELLKFTNNMSKDEIQAFANEKIFKAHYGKMLADLLAAIKPILIILAIVTVIGIAVSGYNAYMISKIPAIAVQVAPTPTPPVVIG